MQPAEGADEAALMEEMRREGGDIVLEGLREQRHRKVGIKLIHSFEWIVERRDVGGTSV